MLGSTVREIAIGLVFVYLVLSLVVTAASEVIASFLNWRATNLFQGIGELLRDPKELPVPTSPGAGAASTAAKPKPAAATSTPGASGANPSISTGAPPPG